MSYYQSDRTFTNYIHQHLALKYIYPPLGWTIRDIEAQKLDYLDVHQGIDYVFNNKQNQPVTVQERFREGKYHRYTDFTLRYRRDDNPVKERHLSEFFKIKARYMVYGITNGRKSELQSNTAFFKFAVINLQQLLLQIKEGNIVIKEGHFKTSYMQAGKLIVPVNANRDKSSTFVAFDIRYLNKLFPNQIVVLSYGFE